MNEAGGANPVPSEMKAFEPTELLFTRFSASSCCNSFPLIHRKGEKVRLGAE